VNSTETIALADRAVWPYRLLARLRSGPLFVSAVVAAALLVLGCSIAAFTHEFHVLLGIPTLALLIGLAVGTGSFVWHRRALGTLVDAITPAAVQVNSLDEAVRTAFRHFPPNGWLLGFGLLLGSTLYLVFPQQLSSSYRVYHIFLCIAGGLLFGYGVVGFIWTYNLILILSQVSFSLFYSHRLLAISTLACGLAFFGVWPIAFTAILWAIHPNVIVGLVGIAEIVLLFTGWALAGIGIHRINTRSRQVALDVIARHLDEQWAKFQAAQDLADRTKLYEAIEQGHKLLENIKHHQCRIVDWGALCGKVLIPLVIAATTAVAVGLIKPMVEPQANTANQPAGVPLKAR